MVYSIEAMKVVWVFIMLSLRIAMQFYFTIFKNYYWITSILKKGSMLLFFILNAALVSAQSVTHITTSQGLSTNDLTATIKDRNNNMWVGSTNGINKHEGARIKIYNKIGKDAASISSAEMHCFFEDKLGFIWVGTTGGLDKINPSNDVITHYSLNSGNSLSPSIGYIFSITQDKYDSIWVSTNAGFFKLDYKTGNSIKIKIAGMDGSILPKCITGYKPGITTDKGIWFVTSPIGVVFYDYLKHEFFHRFNNPMQKAIFNLVATKEGFHVTDMCSDNEGNLYFVSRYNNLIKYNYDTEKIDSFRIPFPTGAWLCCNSMVLDSHHNIWIGYRHGGILIFNTTTHDFTPIINDDSHHLLSSNYVYSICKDYQGKMWVATNKGLDIIDYYNSSSISYTLSDKPDYTDLKYHSGTISYANETVHIPFYESGVFNFDTKTGEAKFYEGDVKTKKSVNYIWADRKGLKLAAINNNINTIRFAKNSFATTNYASVLNKLLLKNNSTIIWREHVNEKEIYKCADSRIYIVENNVLIDTLNGDGIMKEACISADKKGLWYLTKQNELVYYNLTAKKADTILIGEACKKIDFALNLPRDLLDDGKSNIWITSQNGLLKYDLIQKKLVAFTTDNNLSHNFNYALALDRFGGIWAENLGGIDFYDNKNGAFKNAVTFSSTTYMNTYGSSIYGKDSLVYFLSGNQLYKINPTAFNSTGQIQPTITLNEVRVNGNTALFDTTNRQLSFTYRESRFEFKFSVLDFVNQKLVKYFYYIEGLDKTWIDAGNKSEVTYNAVQPGSYIFHVKATDAAGNEIKKELSVPFKIVPPFWKTTLFYFSVFLAFCGAIFFFARWREKNIKIIEDGKLKLEQLNANQFKNKLELEQIVNYFSSSLLNKNSVDDVLWDVTENLIGRLDFVDCMIYLWNADKTKMIQRAGHGPKGTIEDIENSSFDVVAGQGVVGYVIQTKEPVLIPDTTKDARYRVDDINRLSEITVPIIYDDELLGVIDSEHHEKNFFNAQHMQVLSTIAGMMGNKIKSIEAEKSLTQAKIEMLGINEKLSAAKLEALRSQMNPHFIFNSLNAIQECILTNKVDAAYEYLSKFSKLQRMVLNNSAKEFITLSSEIEMLKLYLSLESLRFSQSFAYTIEIEKNTDADDIQLPSMLIQPYVENAIWHGLRNKSGDKILKISCVENVGQLIITIDDNGIGRVKAAAIKAQKLGTGQVESKGTILTEERINILSLKYNAKIMVETIDKLDNLNEPAGTTIIITLPVDIKSHK